MREIATIMFTGLCLFMRAPNNTYTVHFVAHRPASQQDIPEHRPFVKIPVNDVDWGKTKRQPSAYSTPNSKFAIFYLKSEGPNPHFITFNGSENPTFTIPITE